MKKIQTNYGGEKLIFVYRKWGGGCHNRTTSRIVPPKGLETLIIETSFPGKLTDKEVSYFAKLVLKWYGTPADIKVDKSSL